MMCNKGVMCNTCMITGVHAQTEYMREEEIMWETCYSFNQYFLYEGFKEDQVIYELLEKVSQIRARVT